MSRTSIAGGVIPAGANRIRFDFKYEGVRYRPTLLRTPSESTLRWARQHLEGIKHRIADGTFSFAEEFPDFRHLKKVPDQGSPKTCAQVFDAFRAHCGSRVTRHDLASITLASYRRVLDGFWRPRIGAQRSLDVRYSTLVRIADNATWSKKSYNNAISILRRAFKFGYRDHSEKHDPTLGLKSVRIRKKDRPVIDPFTIQEAEALIAAIHRDWGEAQGNYDEFRFFTGLRPSEQIALVIGDFDPTAGTLAINKARVAGMDKDSTKTAEDRSIVLCPRAMNVLRRQLVLRSRLERTGRIDHDHLFFKASGALIRNLQYPYVRWRRTLDRLATIRYRRPYCARHASVSWDLMIGRNALWVAQQHGHSITTMLRVYTAWAEGAIEADLKAIERATQSAGSTAETLPGGAADAASAITASDSARSKPDAVGSTSFGSGFGSTPGPRATKCRTRKGIIWRERGIRTASQLIDYVESSG